MDDGMNMNMKNMQPMSFYWGSHAVVLFSGWPEHSLRMYILALLVVLLMAFFVEILSLQSAVHKPDGTVPIVKAFTRACVYAFRIGLSYLVMLAVMSFNVGIFIAAVAGHAIGFFIGKSSANRRSNQEDEDSYHP
ncbi:Ctr copper transporter [Parasponia andersonii]|uniref:Copper transport protein n=1 Tax=Parasponia andersonii TaxID=3476 RepID=A0A2P5CG35_PARAD|nr:Ctr copper transporter [Parasponia andersonii]